MTQKELIERWVLGDPMFTLEPMDNGMLRFRKHTIRWHQLPAKTAVALRYNGHVLMQPGTPRAFNSKFNDRAAEKHHSAVMGACFRREVRVCKPLMNGIFAPAINLGCALIRHPDLVPKRLEEMQMAFLNLAGWYHETQWMTCTFIHDMFPELPRLHPDITSLRNWIELARS